MRPFLVLMVLVPSVTFAANDEEEEKPAAGEAPEARKKFAEGNEKYARGDYDGAVEAFKASIAADPKLPGPYRNLGLAYRAQGKCAVGGCNTGAGDCDGNYTNGCEANLNTDNKNCGACGSIALIAERPGQVADPSL